MRGVEDGKAFEKGLNNTTTSRALLTLMDERQHHAWTLEDLQAGLTERHIAADFSSVFRAAEKLTATGAIRKLMLEDGRARFELRRARLLLEEDLS